MSIIVAMAGNRVIGKDNGLPWRLPGDLKRFKSLTMGHHIIMGRKTFESIGRPLPGRINVVVTRNAAFRPAGVTLAGSVAAAIDLSAGDSEIFVIGGAELYRESLGLANRIYLTEIHANVEGDTFFPQLDPGEWREFSREHHPASTPLEHDSDFVVLERQR